MSTLPNSVGDNRLPALAGEIEAAHQRCKAGVQEALDAVLAAGRGLIEARELVPHGQWQDWLRANVPEVSVRTAQRYMKAAEKAKSDTVSFSSLRELLHPERSREPAPAANWWWRKLPAEGRGAWWEKYPQDFPHAVLALDEDGASREAIAAELCVPVESLSRLLAETAVEPPPYRYSEPRADGKDVKYWRAEFEFDQRFDRLMGLMVRFYHSAGAGSALQASVWADVAGRPDLAARLMRRSKQQLDEMGQLHERMIALEPDGPTRAVAAFITESVAAGDWPGHLDGLLVGRCTRLFLELPDHSRRFFVLVAGIRGDADEPPPAFTAADLPGHLTALVRASEVWERYLVSKAEGSP